MFSLGLFYSIIQEKIRSDTLSTHYRYVRQIYGKLGVENRRQATVRAQALGFIEGLSSPGIRPHHNLPAQTTPFIGREQELDELEALLADPEVRLIKLVADAMSNRLLGAHVLAPEAGETIQAAVIAIKADMTVQDLTDTFFPYLTMAEGIKLAAQAFEKDVTMLSCCAR